MKYEKPLMDIIVIESEDVIRTSGTVGDVNSLPGDFWKPTLFE